MQRWLELNRLLDRLDRLTPWAFTGSLYGLRWVVVLPVTWAVDLFDPTGGRASFEGPAIGLLLGFLFLAPILETLAECLAPYWIMRKMGRIPSVQRPWGFVAVSAGLMALWHVDYWPAAFLPSTITGAFLAYTFAHFAPGSPGKAFLHTWVFHAGINLVGWLLIVSSR